MFEAIVNLRDFESLENTIKIVNLYEEKETNYCDFDLEGYVRVSKKEFAEVMAESLKYEVEENNNINPKWQYDYEFTLDNVEFEVKEILKIEDDYVYFEVV